MNSTVSIQRMEDIIVRPLAPVVPIKPAIRKYNKPKRKKLNENPVNSLPLFYDKPIYKSKKYDLL